VCVGAVEAIFRALSDGAEANPDEMEGDEGNFFFNEADTANGMDAPDAERLQALEERLNLPSAAEFEQLIADQQPPEALVHPVASAPENGDAPASEGTDAGEEGR
jgi:hypothetical protein